MARERALTDEACRRLAFLPPPIQAVQILRGECGPLSGIGYTDDQASIAYLAHLGWVGARRTGAMLAKAAVWEARESFAGRIRTALGRYSAMVDLPGHLQRELALPDTWIRTSDLLWWRRVAVDIDSRGARSGLEVNEVVSAALILTEGYLYEIRDFEAAHPELRPTAAPDDTDTELPPETE